MPIKDFIEQYSHGDDFDWDAFKAAAIAEANKDEGITNAKVDALNTSIAAKDAEINSQKVEMFDMFKKIPASNNQNPATPSTEDEADMAYTLDDAFGKKE